MTATLSFKNPLQKPTGDVHFFIVYGSGLKLDSWRATTLQSLASTSSKSEVSWDTEDLDYLDQVCLIRVGVKLCRAVALQELSLNHRSMIYG